MTDRHPPEITIKADDEVAKARFSNLAQVGSTNDAIALDFCFVHGVTGWLLSRILMSPAHAKRFHRVLGDTLARHEEAFGPIDEGPSVQ